MADRACVMQLDQDFIDGHWSVSCFCGWEAETLWDDQLDAEEEYQRHRVSVGKRAQSEAASSSAVEAPTNDLLGPD